MPSHASHTPLDALKQLMGDVEKDAAAAQKELEAHKQEIAQLKKQNRKLIDQVSELQQKIDDAPDLEQEIKRLREVTAQLETNIGHLEQRDAKRRKLAKDASYAQALSTGCCEANDHVLVHWPQTDMWSVAAVCSKYKAECPAMLQVKCAVTQNDQHLFSCVHPSDVTTVTSRNVEGVLRKVVNGTNLKLLAQTGKNTTRPETDKDFARRVLRQTAAGIRNSLTQDAHLVAAAENVVATSTPELQ